MNLDLSAPSFLGSTTYNFFLHYVKVVEFLTLTFDAKCKSPTCKEGFFEGVPTSEGPGNQKCVFSEIWNMLFCDFMQ